MNQNFGMLKCEIQSLIINYQKLVDFFSIIRYEIVKLSIPNEVIHYDLLKRSYT